MEPMAYVSRDSFSRQAALRRYLQGGPLIEKIVILIDEKVDFLLNQDSYVKVQKYMNDEENNEKCIKW